MARKKLLHFNLTECECSRQDFLFAFIQRIADKGKLTKKQVDEIYTNLVNEWENKNG